MKVFNFFSILLLLLVVSCGKQDVNSQNIEFDTISQGSLNGNGEENISKQNIVIFSQSEMDNLINKIKSPKNISIDFKEIQFDFSKYILIGVFDEVKDYNAKIYITKIIEKKDIIEVFIKEENGLSPVINQPFHIVKILKTTKEIKFKKI